MIKNNMIRTQDAYENNGLKEFVRADRFFFWPRACAAPAGTPGRGPSGGAKKTTGGGPWRGRNGVSTDGVTANFTLFDRGTFWVLPLTYFYISQSARAYLFPNLSKIITFGVDPICPQPNTSY